MEAFLEHIGRTSIVLACIMVLFGGMLIVGENQILDKITNPVLLQSDKFKKKYETLKQRVDSLIEKYNKAYVDSRLNKVGLENLSKRINVEKIGNITVEDYIYNYLVPNMNSHQYVIINGQELYIGDILEKLKAYVESNSDNKRK